MKKFLIQAILLLTVIGGAIFFFSTTVTSPKIDIPFLPQSPTFVSLQINGNILKAEVADTDNKRNKGLGGREKLASDEGMLFIFEREGYYPFWMKGLKFPLDFIWIKGDKVVDILPNVPPPASGQKDSDLPIYQSKVPIDKVLEVNSGTSDRLHIKLGDMIKIE